MKKLEKSHQRLKECMRSPAAIGTTRNDHGTTIKKAERPLKSLGKRLTFVKNFTVK